MKLGPGLYFLPRAVAERARVTPADLPVVQPTRRLTPLLERPDGPPPAKLSPADAERLLGIPVRILR